MKLSLDEIKTSLRIDYPDDDAYLELLNDASVEQLKDMTGFDLKRWESSKAKVVCLALIHEMYKDRSLTTDKAGEKIKPVMQGMLIQLSHNAKERMKADGNLSINRTSHLPTV